VKLSVQLSVKLLVKLSVKQLEKILLLSLVLRLLRLSTRKNLSLVAIQFCSQYKANIDIVLGSAIEEAKTIFGTIK
jgi:hypothetical protein